MALFRRAFDFCVRVVRFPRTIAANYRVWRMCGEDRREAFTRGLGFAYRGLFR